MKRFLLLILLAGLAFAQSHSVTLNWVASTTPGVTYNVYKLTGACPAGTPTGFAIINSSPITALTYSDTAVVAGATYCYYGTAVLNGAESGPSNTAAGAVPPFPQTMFSVVVH